MLVAKTVPHLTQPLNKVGKNDALTAIPVMAVSTVRKRGSENWQVKVSDMVGEEPEEPW